MKFELPGRRVEWFAATESTMIVAARLAREGSASGTVVGADQQTAGIGRAVSMYSNAFSRGLYACACCAV